MTRDDVLKKVNEIFTDVFDDASLSISEDTAQTDIGEWDSLAQIDIIAACESEFGVTFNLADIPGIKAVGDLIDLVLQKKI